jgi:Protein of unknown function (DUF3108)
MTSRAYFLQPRVLCAAAALCVAWGVLAPLAISAEAGGDTLNLSYGIYVGGSRVYKITYSASLTPDGYRTAVTMAPKGMGKLFASFKLSMASAGLVADGQPQPVDFSMESSKNDEHKKVSMTWSADGLPKANRSFRMPKDRAAALDQVLDPQIPDPLTAILRHAINTRTKPCARPLRSYNGAEVYDLEFKFLGKDAIADTKNGAYAGPAYKCQVVFVPIAGYPEKKFRKLLSKPPTYIVWFADVVSPSTSTKFLVPVQASGRAGKRKFTILASGAEMSGQPLTALSQLDE